MIRFLKIVVLVMFSCFLTTGRAFASIQVPQEIVSNCKSSVETKDFCNKKVASNNECNKKTECSNLIPNLVVFSEKALEVNVHVSHFNSKKQPNTWVQMHFASPFIAIWLPPRISLIL